MVRDDENLSRTSEHGKRAAFGVSDGIVYKLRLDSYFCVEYACMERDVPRSDSFKTEHGGLTHLIGGYLN